MGLLDDIRGAQWKPATVCFFAEYIAGLSKEDKAGLLEALDDRSISGRAIFIACRNNGYTGGDSVVRRHRRGECVCL